MEQSNDLNYEIYSLEKGDLLKVVNAEDTPFEVGEIVTFLRYSGFYEDLIVLDGIDDMFPVKHFKLAYSFQGFQDIDVCNHDFRPVIGLFSILGHNCIHCDKKQEDFERELNQYVSDDIPF